MLISWSRSAAIAVTLVALCGSPVAADGISGRPVPLGQILSTPAYAVRVDGVRPVANKPAISAVVREVLGAGTRPVASAKLVVGKRVELPIYRPPRGRKGKWVIARRYWNACTKPKAKALLLVSTYGYFETLCDTMGNKRKLKLFVGTGPRRRFEQRTTFLLRRDLADGDLFHWAFWALKKRKALRDRDIIRAAALMPERTGANPLFAHANNLKSAAKIRFLRHVLRALPKAKRKDALGRVAREGLYRKGGQELVGDAIGALTRLRLGGKKTRAVFCSLAEGLIAQLKKKPARSKAAAGRLRARMARLKASRESCSRTWDALAKLLR
jgi:hypothetical protein